MSDIRAAKMCSRGGRAWAEKHGFNWSMFLREGIEAENLIKTGDAMAARLVEVARERR
jgi:hypothetical protein